MESIDEQLKVAVLLGDDEAKEVVWNRSENVKLRGNNDMWRLIRGAGLKWHRLHIAPNYFGQEKRWRLDGYDVVCNQVTNPDLNPKTLDVVEGIKADAGRDIVNDPTLIRRTKRSEIARRLRGIPSLIVPRAIHLRNPTLARLRQETETSGFQFPALVRHAGAHGGKFLRVCNRSEDMEPYFGDARNDYVLTEFVDFVSDDGFYRKARFFFIGDTILQRHHLISREWNIHMNNGRNEMRGDERLRREEQRHLEEGLAIYPPATLEALKEVRRRVELDYFGMDCSIRPDGQIILFEANATMNFFPVLESPPWSYLMPVVPRAREAMRTLIESRATRPATANTSAG